MLQLGMTLAPLDEALRKHFSINSKVTKGLVVTEVHLQALPNARASSPVMSSSRRRRSPVADR